MAQNDSQPSGNSEHSSRSSEEEEDEEEDEERESKEQNLATENKSIAIKQLEKRRLSRSY